MEVNDQLHATAALTPRGRGGERVACAGQILGWVGSRGGTDASACAGNAK